MGNTTGNTTGNPGGALQAPQAAPSSAQKRKRGRPTGSTAAAKRFAEAASAANQSTLEVVEGLAELNPSMPAEKISARMSPQTWDAERKRLMIVLLEESNNPD